MMATSSPPRNVDKESFLALYVEDLAEFDEQTLSRAYTTARRERPSPYWIRPEEILKHARAEAGPMISADTLARGQDLIARCDRSSKAYDLAAEWMSRHENGWIWSADFTGVRRWLVENILSQMRNGETPVAFVPDAIRPQFKAIEPL